MQRAVFQPSLRPSRLKPVLRRSDTPQSCTSDDTDKSDRTPGRFTPKYSRAYQATAKPQLASNGAPPHLLPPPPSGASVYSRPKVKGGTPTSYISGGIRPRSGSLPSGCSWTPHGCPDPCTPAWLQEKLPVKGTCVSKTSASPLIRPSSRRPTKRTGENNKQASRNRTRPRIDPEHVPRPIQAEAVKQEGGRVYETTRYSLPPMSTEVCTIVDKGSCSCEFMRCSVNQVPANMSIGASTHIPMAAAIQPFAELTANEDPVPVVDNQAGPLRCPRCKAYVNPFFTWESNGRGATCNFCEHRMRVPDSYYCGIDARGQRLDRAKRPELQRGTVDFVAPRNYTDGPLPGPPVTVLVVDASAQAVRGGLLAQALNTLRQLLSLLEAPASRIALVTFDRAIHFHAFHANQDTARVVTVSDVEDPFLPCRHELLCADVADEGYREKFEILLEDLLDRAMDSKAGNEAAGGAALKAAVELASRCGGGHVVMFHASLPNVGVGTLKHRDDIGLYTEQEVGGLFLPQQTRFLDDLTSQCLTNSVAVSAICAPALGAYMDLATLSTLPRRTGGEVCYLPAFDAMRDGEQLHYTISRAVVQEAAYGCIIKLRCSKGIRVSDVYAPWEPDLLDQSLCQVSRLSTDAAAVFTLNHTQRIEGRRHVYLQAACLYTSRSGRRLIRVHTLRLPVTTVPSNVFRYSDIESVTCLLLRQAAGAALSGDGSFKERLTDKVADMLWAYRVNCACLANRYSPQLILPEALKLLPLYIGTIRKLPALRSSSGIRVDERVAGLVSLLDMPLAQIMPLVYPRTYQLSPAANSTAGLPTGVGDNVEMPPTIRCSADQLFSDRVYLVDNGLELMIYIGAEVPGKVLEETFGTSFAEDVSEKVLAWAASEPTDITEVGCRAFAVCQQIRRDRSRLPWLPITVILAGTPEEARLLASMVEDPISRELSYVDSLIQIHELVRKRLA